MKCPRRRAFRRCRPLVLRGALALGLLPKLLIPVGFMPAALADGGPITPCSGYAAPPTAVTSPVSMPMHGAHVAADDGGAHATAKGIGARADEHGDEHETHHQWERCAYSGTASLAPLAAAWQLAIDAPAVERIGAGKASTVTRAPRIFFRSRAPPLLHS